MITKTCPMITKESKLGRAWKVKIVNIPRVSISIWIITKLFAWSRSFSDYHEAFSILFWVRAGPEWLRARNVKFQIFLRMASGRICPISDFCQTLSETGNWGFAKQIWIRKSWLRPRIITKISRIITKLFPMITKLFTQLSLSSSQVSRSFSNYHKAFTP